MSTAAIELDLKLESMLGGRSTTDRQALEAFAVLKLCLKLLRSVERKPTNGQGRSGPRRRAG
jgi:hypothetical protein